MNTPTDPSSAANDRGRPQMHRTIDRVTKIVEAVVYNPGMTFSDLVRALDAAKSTMHGFVQGLLASGWLYEEKGRFYLGAAIYGLTLASGHIQAGVVSQEDLQRLRDRTGVGVYLGIRAGDTLIYVSMAGDDPATDFYARSSIRRKLLKTAGGKAILSELPSSALDAYLRRQDPADHHAVIAFLEQLPEIRRTKVAGNFTQNGTRFALGAALRNRSGELVASLTLVAATARVEPRREELSEALLAEVARIESRQARQRDPV